MSSAYLEKNVNEFVDNVEALYKLNGNNEDGFAIQFQKIKVQANTLKKNPLFSRMFGEKDENKKKNRYKDILPFDSNRVQLIGVPEGHSNYINASYIKDPTGETTYIAAQGPLPHTVDDFWNMLWGCNVEVIIMVCNEIELGKRKCQRYWANNTEEILSFNDIKVKLISQDTESKGFCIRCLEVKKHEQTRKIFQFHYTTWPDHGTPRARKDILDMMDKARQIQPYSRTTESSPMCVHCSAGCGRTGAVLVIDYYRYLLHHKMFQSSIKVYDVLLKMRQQRVSMVQTKDQFEFVHLAVSEMLITHLKNHGFDEMKSKSNLMKSLGDVTYENIEIVHKPSAAVHSTTPSLSSTAPKKPTLPTATPKKPTLENAPSIKPTLTSTVPTKPIPSHAAQTKPFISNAALSKPTVSNTAPTKPIVSNAAPTTSSKPLLSSGTSTAAKTPVQLSQLHGSQLSSSDLDSKQDYVNIEHSPVVPSVKPKANVSTSSNHQNLQSPPPKPSISPRPAQRLNTNTSMPTPRSSSFINSLPVPPKPTPSRKGTVRSVSNPNTPAFSNLAKRSQPLPLKTIPADNLAPPKPSRLKPNLPSKENSKPQPKDLKTYTPVNAFSTSKLQSETSPRVSRSASATPAARPRPAVKPKPVSRPVPNNVGGVDVPPAESLAKRKIMLQKNGMLMNNRPQAYRGASASVMDLRTISPEFPKPLMNMKKTTDDTSVSYSSHSIPAELTKPKRTNSYASSNVSKPNSGIDGKLSKPLIQPSADYTEMIDKVVPRHPAALATQSDASESVYYSSVPMTPATDESKQSLGNDDLYSNVPTSADETSSDYQTFKRTIKGKERMQMHPPQEKIRPAEKEALPLSGTSSPHAVTSQYENIDSLHGCVSSSKELHVDVKKLNLPPTLSPKPMQKRNMSAEELRRKSAGESTFPGLSVAKPQPTTSAPPLPERTPQSYLVDDVKGASRNRSASAVLELPPASNTTSKPDIKARIKNKSKDVLEKTMSAIESAATAVNTGIHSSSIFEDSAPTPKLRNTKPVNEPSPNEPAAFGSRYPRKPRGPRSPPAHWKVT